MRRRKKRVRITRTPNPNRETKIPLSGLPRKHAASSTKTMNRVCPYQQDGTLTKINKVAEAPVEEIGLSPGARFLRPADRLRPR